jgi:hypothetical protein
LGWLLLTGECGRKDVESGLSLLEGAAADD